MSLEQSKNLFETDFNGAVLFEHPPVFSFNINRDAVIKSNKNVLKPFFF